MRKFIALTLAMALLSAFAPSCRKESLSRKGTDDAEYSFNISVSERPSLKEPSTKSVKAGWENGDRIFLFFKPSEGQLLSDTYAVMSYDGSRWTTEKKGNASLGDGGKLSAVYTPYLSSSVQPQYSQSQWTLASGDVCYNCTSDVSYTVNANAVAATLEMKIPSGYVQFYIKGVTDSDTLTCNNVEAWTDVQIKPDMSVSSVRKSGDGMKGRRFSTDDEGIVFYGVLKDSLPADCVFSVIMQDLVYGRTASGKKLSSKAYNLGTFSTKDWTLKGNVLPGLFSVSATTKVRFSKGNLQAVIDSGAHVTSWKFAETQNSFIGNAAANNSIGDKAGTVDLFGWSTDATYNNWGIHTKENVGTQHIEWTGGSFKDWGGVTGIGTGWHTLSSEEWTYMKDEKRGVSLDSSYVNAVANTVTIEGDVCKGLFLYPDNYSGTQVGTTGMDKWDEINNAGIVFLPSAGYRRGLEVDGIDAWNGGYWSSTSYDLKPDEEGYEYDNAYYLAFAEKGTFIFYDQRHKGRSVRLVLNAR